MSDRDDLPSGQGEGEATRRVSRVQQHQITDDLDALLETLPAHIYAPLMRLEGREGLLEIVLDLGRRPEARFPGREVMLDERDVTSDDLDLLVSRIGEFGDDNRA